MNNLESIMSQMLTLLQEQASVPIEYQLWDEKDIALYLKYSVKYTREHIIRHPFFPPPRKIPTSKNGDRYANRWKATEVIEYAMSFKD